MDSNVEVKAPIVLFYQSFNVYAYLSFNLFQIKSENTAIILGVGKLLLEILLGGSMDCLQQMPSGPIRLLFVEFEDTSDSLLSFLSTS